MSSKFAPSKKSVKLPVVCIAPRANLPLPYVDGLPNALHVSAWWYDLAIPARLAESFPLYADPGLPGWSGSSSNAGLNLRVTVETMPTPHSYDITIEIRQDLVVLDDDSWHAVTIAQGPPFISELLQHIYIPQVDANGIRVLD